MRIAPVRRFAAGDRGDEHLDGFPQQRWQEVLENLINWVINVR